MAVDIFDLVAKIKLDTSDFEKDVKKSKGDLDDFGKSASTFGQVLKANLASGAITKGLSLLGSAIKSVTGSMAGLVKQSVSAYGEYEQLVGGVETLFGESAYKVLEDSKTAFKEAGMSMNEYMETSIQSAASLINSLDGDQAKAAELMKISITDMSDNVNRMGTTMEAVQNAYRGFSRGNFTMLDNLALGFSGTKQGMQELLDKAEEISGIKYDISSYADIVEAIHVVQTEMGITGTTAKEAAETLQGSFAMTKTSWENLVAGLSNPDADLGKLIDDFVSSAETALENLLPIVERTLGSLSRLVVKFLPEVIQKIADDAPQIVEELLNTVTGVLGELTKPETIEKLMGAVLKLVGIVAEMLVKFAPQIVKAVVQIVTTITKALPEMIKSIDWNEIMNMLMEIIDVLGDALVDLIPALIEGVMTIIDKIIEFTTNPENTEKIIGMTYKIILSVAAGLLAAVPKLLEGIGRIIGTVINNIVNTDYGKLAQDLLTNIGKALEQAAKKLAEWWDGWAQEIGKYASIAWDSVVETWSGVGQWFADRWNDITAAFSAVGEWFSETFTLAWEGVKKAFEDTGKWFSDTFSGAWDGITDAFSNAGKFFSDVWEGIKTAFSNVGNWFSETFQGAWDKITEIFAPVGSTFQNIGDSILNGLKSIINGLIWGINQVIKIPFDGLNAALNGIKSIDILGAKPFNWVNPIPIPEIPQLAKGGVLKRGQMALLEGEGGEAVIPLEKNTEWIDKIAEKLNNKQGEQVVYYNFTLDIQNMNANSREDVEKLTEDIMLIMSDKLSRKGVVFA